jgi:hypothetical protein
MGEKRVKDFGGKPRREETAQKSELRWEDGIKMDVKEIG